MKNQKISPGLDLFSPLAEIFHESIVLATKSAVKLAKMVLSKMIKDKYEIKKIERLSSRISKSSFAGDSLGIDVTTQKSIKLSDIDFSKHTFIVGASGFGKTNLISILQENSLIQNKPIIFIDPKGDAEALGTFKGLCQRYNRACYIFSEHDADGIDLNPLLEGSISQVSDRLMSSFTWSEEFYRDACRRSLNSALKSLQDHGKSFSLRSIYEYLIENETKENLGLITKIENILKSDFGKYLNSGPSGLTISKIRKEHSCLYIGLSVQGYGDTAISIGKLFLGELLFNSYKTLIQKDVVVGRDISPVSIFFDEFGSLVTNQFIELENKCRGAGMELTLAVQSASDIDRVSKDLTIQVIENAANIFIFKQRVDSAAAFFSEAIGTVITRKETFVTENGEEQSKGTVREVNELIVHPDIIKNLRIGQCVLLRQGARTQVNLINVRNRQSDKVIRPQPSAILNPGAFD